MALIFRGDELRASLEEEVRQLGGQFLPALSMAVFRLGTQHRFPDTASLHDFVRTQWPAMAREVHACWLDDQLPLNLQFSALGLAEPFSQWLETSTSPLLEILNARRIETWFQPVFRGAGLALWGYECLARARTADGEFVTPDVLFRWAQEDHLVFMLDRICRERHIENAAAANHSADLTFLINFLPTVIYEPSVCLKTTFAAAERANIRPGQIIFEVVETEAIADTDRLAGILNTYRNAGFRVALDDLGSGHAGLTLLGDLHPDLIKIDRALVSRSTESESHRTICRSIVELGHELGKLVLAEGVETEDEYAFFRSLGVDLFQGYLFGKPAPVPATRPLIPSMTECYSLEGNGPVRR